MAKGIKKPKTLEEYVNTLTDAQCALLAEKLGLAKQVNK